MIAPPPPRPAAAAHHPPRSPDRAGNPAQATLRLSRTQHAFVADGHPFAALIAGRGAGKTYAGAVKAAVQEFGRPGLGLVVAPTYPMLRDATWRTALEAWAPLLAEVNRSEMRIALRGGHEVLFRSADDPARLRGPSARWLWIDEAAQCAEQTWPIALGVLRQGGAMGRAWVTTTPLGLNWVYDVFVTRADDSTALFQTTTASNPFVDPAFVAALRAQYPSEFARQELGGEFVTLGAGLIQRHWFRVVERAPEHLRWARYWDLAASTKQTADHTAGVRAALAPDGTLYLADLIRGRWEWPDARRVIAQTMAAEDAEVGIEAAGFQLAAVQDLLRDPLTARRAVRGVAVDKDKLARAQPWIAKAEAGKVFLVRGAWVAEFLAEAEQFPEGRHDDQVDAVSGAVQLVAGGRWNWGDAF
jgi:predicted phage terminase large subunit-like protein